MVGMIIKILKWIISHIEFEFNGIKRVIANLWVKIHQLKNLDFSEMPGFELEENERCVYYASVDEGKIFISDVRHLFYINQIYHEGRFHSEMHIDGKIDGKANTLQITLNGESFPVTNIKFRQFLYRTIWVSALREAMADEVKKDSSKDEIQPIPTYFITVKQAADDVREFKKLLDEGIITVEEYEKKRVELLRLE